jgi:ElaB/YqjD/DUF883 family membrane-anchored ribosome-binding protein
MPEVNKPQQSGPRETDTNELQSTRADSGTTDADERRNTRTQGKKAAADLKSEAGAVVEKYSDTAEQVWDDAKERVRTFKEDADEYVRENPTKAVLAALAIGFVFGLITMRR